MVSLTGLTICLLFQVYLAEVVALTFKVVAAAVNLEFFEVELPRGLRPPAEVGTASWCRRGVGILAPVFLPRQGRRPMPPVTPQLPTRFLFNKVGC